MARLPEAQLILEAAERWRNDCLLAEGSIFTGESLWTRENAEALVTHYSENLDEGEGDFFQKFEGQLANAPPPAIRLASEILWVMYLIVSGSASSGATKRLQLKKVFAWSGQEIEDDHWALGNVLDQGVAHPGTAYQTHRWRELVFFIDFLVKWTGLSVQSREQLLGDAWTFAEWLNEVEGAGRRQLPHILCFLLFPDSFERIASGSHKEKIIKAFADRLSDSTAEYSDRVSMDRAVLEIRESLKEEYGENLDFYAESEIAKEWRTKPKDPAEEPPSAEAAAWLKEEFGDQRVWLLAAGEGGRLWPEFEREGIAAIGWDYLGDLSDYGSRDDMTRAISKETGKANPTNDSLATWEFARAMEPGDIVIAKKGTHTLLGWGRVGSAYRHEPDRDEYTHVRDVHWTPIADWEIPEGRRVANKTLTDFTKYPDWVQAAFAWIDGPPADEHKRSEATYSLQDALDGLFLTKEEFQEILDSLAQRKNLILQGPPGVGKTFIARRIAWRLIGRRAPSNVEFVQFHQSYAYEDFIEGFRPQADGGFELREGVFHRFCTRAAASDEPHVFIIDEINRGNLSRIFGELMMLIEADKRGPQHAISLTYSPDGKRFFVPENVHILGMMNTADRSLALVDYALRRRFAFFSLKPAFGSEKFLDFLIEAGIEERLVRFIDDRFRSLNGEIREDVQNLGPGFEIGHSYFVPSAGETDLDEHWYRAVIRTQVIPLLREYWFDRPELLRKHSAELALQ